MIKVKNKRQIIKDRISLYLEQASEERKHSDHYKKVQSLNPETVSSKKFAEIMNCGENLQETCAECGTETYTMLEISNDYDDNTADTYVEICICKGCLEKALAMFK